MTKRTHITQCAGTDCPLGDSCSIWLVKHSNGGQTSHPSKAWAMLAAAGVDAPDEWIVINGMGGTVCAMCGMPTESEPCIEHQHRAYLECIS